MWPAVLSIVLLGGLIIVHELGHLLVARWCGVRILRFSIGFGPRLFAWTVGHTEYALSAIPFGGYVKMAGAQHVGDTSRFERGDYLAQSPGARALIVFAGPFVNYLVAFLSLWAVFMVGYPQLLPTVGKVVEGMPAHAAGLEAGDHIQAIDGTALHTWEEMTEAISRSPDHPVTLQVDRSGTTTDIVVVPSPQTVTDPFGRSKTIGQIGVMSSGAFEPFRVGPLEACRRALKQQGEWTVYTGLTLWSLVSGKVKLRDSVTGPLGLLYMTSEAVGMGVAPVLFLASLFSLSLAIFNLLPIPILDGGHLFFLAMERLRGRPVSETIQERSAQVSFALLLMFFLVTCVNDLNRFGVMEKLRGWFVKWGTHD